MSKISSFALALFCLNILNAFDAGYTLYWLTLGIEEGNPIMNAFVHQRSQFVVVKMFLVWGGTWILWKNQENILSRGIVPILLGVYTLIALMHVYFFASFELNMFQSF